MAFKEIVEKLTSSPHRIYTAYDLSNLIFHIVVSHKKSLPKAKDIRRNINALLSGEVITEKRCPGGSIFVVTGAEPPDPMEFICAADMFSYVSHWSAMRYHEFEGTGTPDSLYISNPDPTVWRKCANERISKDFSDFLEAFYEGDFLRPIKISPSKIGTLQVINTYTSQYESAFQVQASYRVSTIGRTFLDMVRCPSRCGGISQVIEVFQKNAHKYLDDIVGELNKCGKKIETVRAGYLIDEICGIHDPAIHEWLKNVQRGGSRKLDPNNGYMPIFSEKWCLINVNYYSRPTTIIIPVS